MENEIKDYLILFIDEFGDRAIEKMAEKLNRVHRGNDNPILYNEESYDHLDWFYVAEAKQTTKYNPEGMKVRQKIIRKLKDGI